MSHEGRGYIKMSKGQKKRQDNSSLPNYDARLLWKNRAGISSVQAVLGKMLLD
jgi:hypothetical protein